ncbi:hypothetical protein SAMN03097699_0574 [Flavobacteriaceae bacterium MAR_2010_188]|nr:hypothetical protein SAMN03097699_0574 [Flavobacteriaceae bacterium MAR_2010_188]
MKTKRVATLYARKFKSHFRLMLSWGSILLLSCLLLVVCCSKTDEVETILNQLPDDNGSPDDNEHPDDNGTPKVDYSSDIIYTDIEPDFISENRGYFYLLDLNNDGIIDFNLKSVFYEYQDYVYLELKSEQTEDNSVISVADWFVSVVPIDAGREIFALPSYSDHGEFYHSNVIFTIGNCHAGRISCYDEWKDKEDKYLGIRFLIKEDIHYAWARLTVKSKTEWVIKDYAYNAIPNSPILAGQKE